MPDYLFERSPEEPVCNIKGRIVTTETISILLIEDDGHDAEMLRIALDRSADDYQICHVRDLTHGIALAQS